MKKRAIIVANGDPPKLSDLHFFQSVGFEYIIAADGGVNSLFRLKITPNIIIGDFDSADQTVLHYYNGKSEVIHLERQDDTDVEKALKYAISEGIEEVVLTGATGDRLDHTFCNLGIALKFYDMIKVFITHQKSLLEVREGSVNYTTLPGETISLYGFDGETHITTEGFKYPLKKETLQFGVRESTSNVATGNKVNIEIEGGKIFVIRELRAIEKNGYFSES
ncbi:MAG: thiamine pyrophosphokinase [Melioribacteraceae bacterium]|nr:MAG: thiamine pyrophosphokinase [Melioribacteraceae bacterium]